MDTQTASSLTSLGTKLDLHPASFGELRPAKELANNPVALRARMTEDGYLFLLDFPDLDQLAATRAFVLERLAERGLLDDHLPHAEAVTKPGTTGIWAPTELAKQNQALQKALYTGPMMTFYRRFLGGVVRHYDFTWFRAIPGGASGTYPHCDFVSMRRGICSLYTSWTPIGNIPRELGSRWLTADFKMGDVLIFGMATVHASLDNQTNRFRLSSDSRYQLASEPVDDRWGGKNPVGHSAAGKKGKIC